MHPLKMTLLAAALLTATLSSSAQTSGIIVYEERSKLNLNIDSDDPEALKDIPKEHVVMRELIFDSTASLFHKPEANQGETIDRETDKGRVVIKMDEPDDKIYCDIMGKKRIEQRDFLSRKFLIEIPFSASVWKLTSAQKKILNYPCQEAVLVDSVRKIKAWFTTAIPLSTGPYGVCNLPGMVLAAEFNNGDMVFEAKQIDLKPIDHSLIVKPKEGKKVSREEFNKIVMEKNKEMQEQEGGDGNVIIRIRK